VHPKRQTRTVKLQVPLLMSPDATENLECTGFVHGVQVLSVVVEHKVPLK
jgi:hypothetical protein